MTHIPSNYTLDETIKHLKNVYRNDRSIELLEQKFDEVIEDLKLEIDDLTGDREHYKDRYDDIHSENQILTVKVEELTKCIAELAIRYRF